jgi:dihydrofolate synthase/folylpolyglutamate synthase
MTIRTFGDAVDLLNNRTSLEQLQSFTPQEMEGRLDLLRELLGLFGNPETKYRTIHVTGTKGKGSVCTMLDSMLREAGYRTGLFTSPHLYSFTERLKIGGVPITPDDFTALMSEISKTVAPASLQLLTYFELLSLAAFVYFAEKKVEFAVLEVGLGGRLDSTNICKPEISVITSISYDHMMQLGPTLTEIAAEKSGIVKPSVPVVSTVLHPDAQKVIRDRTQMTGSPFYSLNESFFVRPGEAPSAAQYTFRFSSSQPDFPVEAEADNLTLQLPGSHQIRNASAAIAAFLLLHRNGGAVQPEVIRTGLQKAFIPLRCEIIRRSKDEPSVIFDGAHNRSSVRAFIKTVSQMFPNRRRWLIFGVSQGKDIEGMFAEMSGWFHHIFLTQYSGNPRYFPPQGLKSILMLNPDPSPGWEEEDEFGYLEPSVSLNPVIADSVLTFPVDFDREMTNVNIVVPCGAALAECLSRAESKDVVCITGSMYLAAELRQMYLSR